MACIAAELRERVAGGRVQQALLPDSLSIGLEIYAGQRRRYLLASAHSEAGRVTLIPDKLRRGTEKETPCLLLLRKYVRGAILSEISQPPFERILQLEFDHPELGSSRLLIELMGRHSNIVLVGPGERILDAVKRVSAQMSSRRPILPGTPYTPPPAQAKLSPAEVGEGQLRLILAGQKADAPLWQALVGGLKGVSPLLAREIAFRALGHAQAPIAGVDAPQIGLLLETIRELLAPLDSGQWQPTLVLEEGQPVAYAPYRLGHRGEAQPAASMSEAIEAYTAALARADPYAAAKRPVRAAILAERGRLERRREALAEALAEGSEADRWRQWGEWILTYAHTIAPGQAELIADPTGSGSDAVRIPLDPDRSAAENAQACFARYRKGQRAAAGVPDLLQKVDLALRDLEQLEADLQLAASRPEIDEVRGFLLETGYLQPDKGRRPKAVSARPLSITSADGLTILVGRNSRQNGEVTFRLGRAEDWWFHAHGAAGAHVIVRAAGKPLPPATMRRAAELAAYYSSLRDEAGVLVDYTQRRHVQRIPGAAPGLVTYSHEQTIRVVPP